MQQRMEARQAVEMAMLDGRMRHSDEYELSSLDESPFPQQRRDERYRSPPSMEPPNPPFAHAALRGFPSSQFSQPRHHPLQHSPPPPVMHQGSPLQPNQFEPYDKLFVGDYPPQEETLPFHSDPYPIHPSDTPNSLPVVSLTTHDGLSGDDMFQAPHEPSYNYKHPRSNGPRQLPPPFQDRRDAFQTARGRRDGLARFQTHAAPESVSDGMLLDPSYRPVESHDSFVVSNPEPDNDRGIALFQSRPYEKCAPPTSDCDAIMEESFPTSHYQRDGGISRFQNDTAMSREITMPHREFDDDMHHHQREQGISRFHHSQGQPATNQLHENVETILEIPTYKASDQRPATTPGRLSYSDRSPFESIQNQDLFETSRETTKQRQERHPHEESRGQSAPTTSIMPVHRFFRDGIEVYENNRPLSKPGSAVQPRSTRDQGNSHEPSSPFDDDDLDFEEALLGQTSLWEKKS